MSFFSMLSMFLVIPHIYVFWRMRAAFGNGFWQLPVLLLFVGMLCLTAYGRNLFYTKSPTVSWVIYLWMGLIVISALSFFLVDMARLFLFTAGKIGSSGIADLIPAKRGGFIAVALSLGLACFAYWQALNVRPVHLTLHTEKISLEKPLRIAAISDLHLGRFVDHERLKRITGIIRDVKPDILVLVGDTVDSDMSRRDHDAALIKSVVPHGGGFAVLGNHEAYRGVSQAMAFLKRAGLQVLSNTSVNVLGITIAGVDDPALKHDPNLSEEAALLKGLDRSRFILFLRHRPGHQQKLSGLYDLQISGHTHGGQIWPGPVIVGKINGAAQGLSNMTGPAGQSLLYVLNGAGFWGPPMRLGTPPEVLVIDLAPKRKTENPAER
jgi:predicted MPP superfamily phosphohydrolase